MLFLILLLAVEIRGSCEIASRLMISGLHINNNSYLPQTFLLEDGPYDQLISGFASVESSETDQTIFTLYDKLDDSLYISLRQDSQNRLFVKVVNGSAISEFEEDFQHRRLFFFICKA